LRLRRRLGVPLLSTTSPPTRCCCCCCWTDAEGAPLFGLGVLLPMRRGFPDDDRKLPPLTLGAVLPSLPGLEDVLPRLRCFDCLDDEPVPPVAAVASSSSNFMVPMTLASARARTRSFFSKTPSDDTPSDLSIWTNSPMVRDSQLLIAS